MYKVSVETNEDALNKYVAEYVTEACKSELDRQLKDITTRVMTVAIQNQVRKLLKSPEIIEAIHALAGDVLARKAIRNEQN